MAYTYTISQSQKLTHILFGGETYIEEILACIKEVVFDEQFQPDFKILIEIQAHYIPTIEELFKIADLITKLRTQFSNKVALSISERFLTTMMRSIVYKIKRETSLNIAVFDDKKKAFDWLNTD